MLRRVLLAVSASQRVRRLITTTPVTRSVVQRFVAGDSAADALAVVQRLIAEGLLVTLDYLGEYTTEPEHATAVTGEYIALIELLAASGLTSGGRTEVSVKPTAVGLGLAENGEKTAAENIARVCSAARGGRNHRHGGHGRPHQGRRRRSGWSMRSGPNSPTSAACSSPTCGARRETARRWPVPAPESDSARGPTPRPTASRWPRARRSTGTTPAACGSCSTATATRCWPRTTRG